MSKYYKAEDVLAIFSEEERPLNWTDSESEIQAQNDFDCYKGMIESLPTIEVSKDCISKRQAIEAIDEVDWYHVGFTGELIHGAASDDEAWYKAEDVYKAIESLPSGEDAFRVI